MPNSKFPAKKYSPCQLQYSCEEFGHCCKNRTNKKSQHHLSSHKEKLPFQQTSYTVCFQTRAVYPINRHTLIPGEKPSYHNYMTGVEGIVPEAEYQAMIKKMGGRVPIDFHGYNNYNDFWPFWSSEPYTYVTNMLALAKFSNTVDESDLHFSA